jgi:very-short-patch-repair endonuclease
VDTAESVTAKLLASRLELLDLTLRNPLLNYRGSARRGVEIVGEGAEQVFGWLIDQGKPMRFHATKPSQRKQGVAEADFAYDKPARTARRPSRSGLKPIPADDSEGVPAPLENEDDGGLGNGIDTRDNSLATPYTREVLDARLLATWYNAWLGYQERGCNTLFLACGMLRWRESEDSTEDRFAPLVLLPVRLDRSSARNRWSLVRGEDEPGGNISLAEKVKEFAIRAPESGDLESAESLAAHLAAWEQAIAGHPGWAVERGRLGLGFFSFSRFLMWRDLDPAQWPADRQPGDHPLLGSLFGSGFREGGAEDGERSLDERRPAGQAMEILDCDSSQATAIDLVARGRSLVIHGPPGTGKSQTIANLLADAVGRGKRVLFVADKLAALEVVKRRLDACGLGALCLELHSDKANKRAVLEDLRATLQLGKPMPADAEQAIAALPGYRDRLNRYAAAASLPVEPSGMSAFSAIGQSERLKAVTSGCPALPTAPLLDVDLARYRHLYDLVAEMARNLGELGVPADHPFSECVVLSCLPGDEGAMAEAAEMFARTAEAWSTSGARLAAAMGLPLAPTPSEMASVARMAQAALAAPDLAGIPPIGADWDDRRAQSSLKEAISAGRLRAKTRADWGGVFREEAWTTDVAMARADIALSGGSWWRRLLSGRYRAARRAMAALVSSAPITQPVRLLAGCDAILACQAAEKRLDELQGQATALLGARWLGPATDWDSTETVSAWTGGWRKAVATEPPATDLGAWVVSPWDRQQLARLLQEAERDANALAEAWRPLARRVGHPAADASALATLDIAALASRARNWAASKASMVGWSTWCLQAQRLREAGCGALVELARKGAIPSDKLLPCLERTRALSVLERAFAQRPELREFDAVTHDQLVERFRSTDRAVFDVNRSRLALAHWEAIPGEAGFGHVGTLRRECAKKARHMPLRQLMAQAGGAIQAVKPICMMSPLSVAAFLPPGAVMFDLVVFDEASQVRPVDALGAILRGRQLVVVGDEQQMPPTSFFDRMVEGDTAGNDEDQQVSETADMQSVLGLCLGKGMHQAMLRWHYRSRHESLIALSNREFYHDDLVVFPSARRGLDGEGLVLQHLSGTAYERGGSRTNPKEADAVVAAVIEHMKTRPKVSLGVVAFSSAQRSAIEDRIEAICRDDPAIEALLNETCAHEPYFVKNLENVQGDERDVIFISVGYGKDAEGHLTMNFGPLGQQGGERRLNVLITRARVCCRVFTNLRHEDIDLRRASGRGIQVFKQFLQFAASGRLEMAKPSGAEHDSPFEAEVCDDLRRRGFEVEPQVGTGGYRIDLAIIDGKARGRYLLGIECDGATYHSSRWARDRDRLREGVLRSLGWRIHRIWSTDWFRQRESAVRRLLAAIAAAQAGDEGPSVSGREATVPFKRDPQKPPSPPPRILPYKIAGLRADMDGHHLADLPPEQLGRVLAQVIGVESPMHIEDLRRRVLDAIEGRAGTRRLAAIDGGVAAAVSLGLIRIEGEFLWRVEDHAIVPRDRSRLPEAARGPHLVHDLEYRAAFEAVIAEACGCADEDEAAAQAVAALGVKRNEDAFGRAKAAATATGAGW